MLKLLPQAKAPGDIKACRVGMEGWRGHPCQPARRKADPVLYDLQGDLKHNYQLYNYNLYEASSPGRSSDMLGPNGSILSKKI